MGWMPGYGMINGDKAFNHGMNKKHGYISGMKQFRKNLEDVKKRNNKICFTK